MDQIFAMGLTARVCRTMKPGLAQAVEKYVREQGFDNLMLGFVLNGMAMDTLHTATGLALRAVLKNPERMLKARQEVYAEIKLDMGKPK